jgi:hypothetical protein
MVKRSFKGGRAIVTGRGRRQGWARASLILAACLAGAAAIARTALEPYQPTTNEGHWAALGAADGASVYYRPTLSFSPEGFLLLFGRIEYREPRREGAVTYRSERALMEYDCLRRRERELERTAYPQNNLKGEAVQVPAASDWRSIEEADAVARVGARAACKAQ